MYVRAFLFAALAALAAACAGPRAPVDRDRLVEQCGLRHVFRLKDSRMQIDAGALRQQIPGSRTFDMQDSVTVGLIHGGASGAFCEIGQPAHQTGRVRCDQGDMFRPPPKQPYVVVFSHMVRRGSGDTEYVR